MRKSKRSRKSGLRAKMKRNPKKASRRMLPLVASPSADLGG
jgi:hypothetical protein